jgi:hypothetical protein
MTTKSQLESFGTRVTDFSYKRPRTTYVTHAGSFSALLQPDNTPLVTLSHGNDHINNSANGDATPLAHNDASFDADSTTREQDLASELQRSMVLAI